MSDIDEIVSVTVTQQSATVTQAGFGVPLIVGSSASSSGWSERFRVYTDIDGVAADFDPADPEYKAAVAVFSQSPTVEAIKIARRSANVAAVKLITLAGDLVTGNTIATTVNGFPVSTTFATDHQATATAFAAAIAAIDGVASAVLSGSPYHVITVTATAGRTLTIGAVTVTGGASQTTAVVSTSVAGNTVADQMDLLVLETDDFYGVQLADSTSVADQLTLAGWIEPRSKLAIFRTTDTGNLDGTTTAIGYRLDALGYHRSAVLFTENSDEMADAAWLGVMLSVDADTTTATWKFKTLVGVTASSLTATETAAAQLIHVNLYRTIGGVSITSEGYAASGRFLDLTLGTDWLQARIKERVFALLAASPKVPFTDAGIAAVENQVSSVVKFDAVATGFFTNDPAPTVTVPKASAVSTANRAIRTLTPVKFTGTVAGAVHKVIVSGVVSV